MRKILGIEIGGTKLQFGVAEAGSSQLLARERYEVSRGAGAGEILDRMSSVLPRLVSAHRVDGVGVGFGGPTDALKGLAITSHQVQGWDQFPLAEWCRQLTQQPVVIDNDCNVAALAEATLGAGRGADRVFYVTVGTGIGGGFVVGHRLDGEGRLAMAEIGHLRPGLAAARPDQTVESVASGLGMERRAQSWLQTSVDVDRADEAAWRNDLLDRCHHVISDLKAKHLSEAAIAGNPLAQKWLAESTMHLGWAIGQMITLLAPEIVVLGGGVTLSGTHYLQAVRQQTARYVFPTLRDSYEIVPAGLGEDVVLVGAIQLVASSSSD